MEEFQSKLFKTSVQPTLFTIDSRSNPYLLSIKKNL